VCSDMAEPPRWGPFENTPRSWFGEKRHPWRLRMLPKLLPTTSPPCARTGPISHGEGRFLRVWRFPDCRMARERQAGCCRSCESSRATIRTSVTPRVEFRRSMDTSSDFDPRLFLWVLGIVGVVESIGMGIEAPVFLLATLFILPVLSMFYFVQREVLKSVHYGLGLRLSFIALHTLPFVLIACVSYFGLPSVGAPVFTGVAWYASLLVATRTLSIERGPGGTSRPLPVVATTLALLLAILVTSVFITGVDAYGRYANLYTAYDEPLDTDGLQDGVAFATHLSDLHVAGTTEASRNGARLLWKRRRDCTLPCTLVSSLKW
jgi:hypothetical protein